VNKETLINQLAEIVGPEYVLHSEVDLTLYGYDAFLVTALPEAVVVPSSTEEVSRVAALAHELGLPLVGRGSATSLSGGPVPIEGGIVAHFSRLNRILDIDPVNRVAVVEPGVITLDLQTEVAAYGLQYAPDPASQKVSTLGGNVGENSGGPHCLKYGVTANHVLGLELVLADGAVITLGPGFDWPGYDLTGLVVGSEGTLGLATKLYLRLIPQPEAVKTLLAVYDSIPEAGNTVSAIIAEGIVPATLEMMDKLVIKAVEESIKAGYPLDAEAVLIIELDGLADGLESQAERIMKICRANNVREVRAAADEAERAQLWAGRKGAFGAVSRLRPNYMVCDGTVPRTMLPKVLAQVLEIGREYDLAIGNVFHAGDGNLHPLILFDARNEEEKAKVMIAASKILKACVEAGGTISGEHGIGLEKLKEMPLVFSETEIEAMRAVKEVFDPQGLLNPGKVLPPACGEG